jgi:hypothetical protein
MKFDHVQHAEPWFSLAVSYATAEPPKMALQSQKPKDVRTFVSPRVDSVATQHDNLRRRAPRVTGFLSDQTKAYGRLP